MVAKKIRRRATMAVVLATAAALMLTGCLGGNAGGSGSDGDKYSGEIEWWTVNLKECCSPYFQNLIDEYESMHPDVTIKWVDVPNEDRSTKLLAAIAAGTVPDAVNSGSDTTGLFNDAMADLSKYFTPEEFDAYLPNLLEPLQDENGVQKGIPWYNGGGNLSFYRQSVVEQGGFDAANPPKTWDDALRLARSVHEATGIYGTSILPYSWVVQSEGIQLLNKDRTAAAFNTPETVALIEKYQSYYDDGSIAPGAVAKDNTTPEQSLVNKQLAFMASDTSSNLRFIEENAPDVYPDIVIGHPAQGASGTNILVGQQIFQIPEASDNKAAAAEWLKFVTSPANQLELCKVGTILPSTPESLEDPFFTDITGDTPNDQARRILIEDYPTLQDGSLGSIDDLSLRQLFDEQIRAVMLGTKSADEAMDDAEQQWNEALDKAAKG
jgi:putative chitobiose transport system substrate-binding protein